MGFDLSALAQNLPQLGALAGTLFGGGSGSSRAGMLAGLGDMQHERNQRAYEGVKQFADQLEKIGADTENWNEGARNAAMQERLNLLSPKTIGKIYANPNAADKALSQAWENVRQGSMRPEPNQQIEKNSAASQMSVLPRQVGMTMGAGGGGFTAGFPAPDMSVLRQATTGMQSAQQTLSQPQRQVAGPLSPGEKAQRHLAILRQMNEQMSGGAGGGAGGGGGMEMVPRMNAKGELEFGPLQPNFTTEYSTYRTADGREGAGTVWVDHKHHQAFVDTPQGQQPVQLTEKISRTGITKYETVENGQKVIKFGTPSQLIGQTIQAAVPTKMVQSTGPNGERYTYDIRPGFNGAPNTILAKHQTGVVPFAALKGEMLSFGIAGKQLDNAIKEYKINGSITLPDGTRYVPNGTLMDQNGQPIAPVAGPGARPTTRQAFKVDVATSLAQTIEETQAIAGRLQERYGPITGKISDWAASHGIDLSSDDAEARDVGKLIMNVTSIGGLATSVHSFMSGDFAKDVDATIGRMGQDFQLGMGKLDALYSFANRVKQNSAYTALPTQKNKQPAPQIAPGAKPRAQKAQPGVPGKPSIKPVDPATIAPTSNQQIMQRIQQLLSGGGKP